MRAIGNDLRMDYSAIGETTHLAEAWSSWPPPGSIRPTCRDTAAGRGPAQVTALGPVPVKGLAEPVEVFELLESVPSGGVCRWPPPVA